MSNLSPAPDIAEPKKIGRWSLKRLKGRFLIFSILFHVVLILVATYLVVQTLTPRKKTFTQGPPSTPNKEVKHKIDVVKKKKSMSAPVPIARITSTGISKIALPDMPVIANADPSVPTSMQGPGGVGTSISPGGMTGTGDSVGSPAKLFGLPSGAGLVGVFYDFKRVSKSRDNKKQGSFATNLVTFTTGDWGPKDLKFYKAPGKLYSTVFCFPGIKDTEAGAAFGVPETKKGNWIAHYSGTVITPLSGTFRFMAFGDNAMEVRLDAKFVFDGSDKNYAHGKTERTGSMKTLVGPKAFVAGEWFQLEKDKPMHVDIVVGDEGGVFASGLFIQRKGQAFNMKNGAPNLPLFMTGPVSPNLKKELMKILPETAFHGPIFTAQGGAASPIGTFLPP